MQKTTGAWPFKSFGAQLGVRSAWAPDHRICDLPGVLGLLQKPATQRMIRKAALVLLLLAVCTCAIQDREQRDALTGRNLRGVGSDPQGPGIASYDFLTCLKTNRPVGCAGFRCLLSSNCDAAGMHDVCMSFMNNAQNFDTPGKGFIKELMRCIDIKVRKTVSRPMPQCPTFEYNIIKGEEDCIRKSSICSIAESNPGELTKVMHYPNKSSIRFYNALLESLLECGGKVAVEMQASVLKKIGPHRESLFKILSKSLCQTNSTQNSPTSDLQPEAF